ncbi:2527_t:CDS:2, partial [Entrophospora sp. SA101]
MTEIIKLPSELANELKLLVESIYPKYGLLCKPIPDEYDELSEVEGNLNDEIRKVDEGSDNESNESNST